MHNKNYLTRTVGRAQIPALGFGTWQLTGNDCVEMVTQALQTGYEHIDTAQAYNNEVQVGEGIKKSGVSRDRFFLTTKIFPENLCFKPDNLIKSVHESLDKLDVDYVDLLLLHWPDARVPISETMPALAEMQHQGLTRNIGVSNFTINLLLEAQKYSDVPIAVNQVEFHPFIRQKTLQTFLYNHHIPLTAYSPLACGDVFKNDTLKAIADKHNINPAQVSLAWILSDKNRIAIPKTSTPAHLKSNFDALQIQLDQEDIEAINNLAGPNGRMTELPGYTPEWDD